jgi:hypothetical protein
MYWDAAFDKALSEQSSVTRELIAEREEGDLMIRRLRFTPHKDLPRPVAKLLGTKKLIYEQENRWDRANSTMTWEVIPSILPGKLSAKGTFKVTQTATGCEQVVEGDIDVKVRLIGGRIEKTIVEEVRKSYDRTAVSCRKWLAENT